MSPLEPGLQAMLDAAAERGARLALERVGLHDAEAGDDVRDLRSLLAAWRTARRTALQTAIQIITTAALVALAIGASIRLGIFRAS